MALAVDSEMPSAVGATATSSSLTYSFTNTAGTYLVVGATHCEEGGARTISTVTYAAASVTKFDNQTYNSSVDVWLGAKVTPATGANNVVVTPSAGSGVIISGAISFTGQDGTTPAGTAAKATGTSTTPSVNQASTTVGNIVVAVMADGSSFTGASGTLSWRKNVSTSHSGDNGQMNRAAGTGGTVTMTGTAASDSWGIVSNEIKAAAGGGGAATPIRHFGPMMAFNIGYALVNP